MNETVEFVLAEYDKRAAEEWKARQHMSEGEETSRRDDFLLSMGRHTGQLLNVLIKGAKAKSILEIGTSYGHSTVWLAEAARCTGGRVVTIDCIAKKHEYARAMLTKAGIGHHVEFRLGDAREIIARLPGPFDFVLLDVWKEAECWCLRGCRQYGPSRMVTRRCMGLPQTRARPVEGRFSLVDRWQRSRTQSVWR